MAFVSGTPLAVRSVQRSVSVRPSSVTMSATKNARKAAVIASSVPAALAPVAALAAEGTGKALGVDNVLLLVPLFLIPIAFLTLYLQFGASQDNTDFFGNFDDRRS